MTREINTPPPSLPTPPHYYWYWLSNFKRHQEKFGEKPKTISTPDPPPINRRFPAFFVSFTNLYIPPTSPQIFAQYSHKCAKLPIASPHVHTHKKETFAREHMTKRA